MVAAVSMLWVCVCVFLPLLLCSSYKTMFPFFFFFWVVRRKNTKQKKCRICWKKCHIFRLSSVLYCFWCVCVHVDLDVIDVDAEQKVRRSELWLFLFLVSVTSDFFLFLFFFFGSLGSRDDMKDDIGVSVKCLLDLNCNLTGQGQRGRETMLCVTPQSQISSDVISSQSRSFQRHLPPLPPSLLPPTHRPHPPASPVSSPLPSLHPFPLTVFTPKNRKFTITSCKFFGFVDVKLLFSRHEGWYRVRDVTQSDVQWRHFVSEQVVSKTSSPLLTSSSHSSFSSYCLLVPIAFPFPLSFHSKEKKVHQFKLQFFWFRDVKLVFLSGSGQRRPERWYQCFCWTSSRLKL